MKTATAILTVRLLGDNQTSKAFRDAQAKAQAFEQGLSKAAGVATKALGGLAIGAGLSVKAASDLEETFNAVGKTFGSASDKITEFGENAADSVGLSQRAFQQMATTTGALLTNMGYSQDEAADSTINLAQRAADMASVFNTDVDTALEAINAGLRGESEPLRAFGVGLSDAALKAKALEMGLYDGKGALDASTKALATEALILDQTSKYAGDFADTSGSLANSQRTLMADVENLGAQLGTALLPVAQRAVEVFTEMVAWAQENSSTVQILAGVVGGLAAAVIVANAAYKAYNAIAKAVSAVQALVNSAVVKGAAAWVKNTAKVAANKAALIAQKAVMVTVKVATAAWTAAQWLLNAALTANPIGLVVAAVALLIGGVVLAYQKSETFRNIVNSLGRALKSVLLGAVNAVKSAFNSLSDALRSAWNWMRNLIGKAGELLNKLNPFKGLGNILGGLFGRAAVPAGAAPAVRGGYPAPLSTVGASGGTRIIVQGSLNPQRTAQELAYLLGGARVRTGFAGVRA